VSELDDEEDSGGDVDSGSAAAGGTMKGQRENKSKDAWRRDL
jgi:hypothetical protein